MPFIAGELAAVLRLDGKQKFDNDLRSSGREFTAVSNVANRAGSAVAGSFKAAGVALNVVLASTVALGSGVIATGLAYNQLQQNSRVALRTLVGGAEAANAQMDKLDAFAKNSPFSKAVFIQAQQQLIGFGVEASKVVPYLDAIQNQVAAIGGSNQTIADVVSILAKIRSGAVLGGSELDQLAGHGINAASLIASQMGITEQEFRDSIFGSPLKGADALKGLDALVAGMDAKFKGAASGIKEQMTGATDRVKAATRDIGAALAEPFVAKNGGGQAVVWANQVADVLRALESKATPFTQFVVTKLQPAFDVISDGLILAKNEVKAFDMSDLDSQLGKLSSYAPALGLVGGALASYGTHIPVLSSLGLTINPVVGGLIGLVAASPDVRNAGVVMFRSLEPLGPVVRDIAGGLNKGLDGAAGEPVQRLDDLSRRMAAAIAVGTAVPAMATGVPVGGSSNAASGAVSAPATTYVSFKVYGAPGQSPEDIAMACRAEWEKMMREQAANGRSAFADKPDWE